MYAAESLYTACSYVALENKVGSSPNLFIQHIVINNALTTFLRYHPLRNDQNSAPELYFNNRIINVSNLFKTYLHEKLYCNPTYKNFWLGKFKVYIDKDFWSVALESTKESRLRELHFKILHNIYPTNILLAKIGVAINNKCHFCTDEIDFIEHFFYDCPKIRSVWKRVQDKFFVRFNKQIQISQMVALLGLTDRNSLKKEARIYLNHLMLIAKMCVGIHRYNSPIHIDCLFERECNLRKL